MIHIDTFSFGSITVGGRPYNSDIKIVNDRVVSNWWRAAGHRVAAEDLEEILTPAAGIDVLVIGMGNPGLMMATAALRETIKKKGIHLVEEPTDKAVAVFNRLSTQGRQVAGAFHVGC